MAETNEEQVRREVLDAYFLTRRNLPEEGAVQQNRSTEEILDDVADMMTMTKKDVIDYMIEHDYHPTTEQDGSVKWAIWRLPI